MKTIKIDHIGKTEGHMSFAGALVNGDFAEARIETEEGSRLIEGILLNRKYYEAPIITARICGVCPIVHNLTAIKALEQALNIEVTQEILTLRKILINAQWIHSHALHAFFLSFPDLIGISNDFDLVAKYPNESKLALDVRDYGVRLAKVIGGRTIHPINSVIGGFNIEPDFDELNKLISASGEVLSKAEKMFNFIIKQKLPKLERPTNYVTLNGKSEYAIYDGKIYFSDGGQIVSPEKFLYDVEEIILPYEKVKRVSHLERAFLVGALARVNNNFDKLNQRAQASWKKLKVNLPCYNSFYNIFAQAVEIIHSIEEINKLFAKYENLRKKKDFRKKLKVSYKPNPGRGFAVMEAPRGILYHEYELDREGNILHCNIITPTAMFLANLEKDLQALLLKEKNTTDKKRDLLIKTLIRAYDPCISCATH
ncbi:MAG: Ni/Fe hydrogenase subunit alpha [Parcubacteria group bacterium]